MKILLVDDQIDLVELLSFVLAKAGHQVIGCYNVRGALKALAEQPDLAVLDVNLGPESGFDLLRELRQRTDIPVILLTARGDEEDKVHGLGQGADDYVTKPFSHRELLARIQAQLRRRGEQQEPKPPLTLGGLRVDLTHHVATLDGRRLPLSSTEFRLISTLLANAGRVVPSHTLLREVWGYSEHASADVVRAAIHRLRRKLGDDPAQPRFIQTVPGVGFLLSREGAGAKQPRS